MATADDALLPVGNELGLILNQLKIITILLRQGLNVSDEDITILPQVPPTLNPPLTSTL